MYVFANGRRIQDYSLVHTLEYGTQGWFPNGTHPLGALFIDIDPALADFNIHPAKREVRFRDPGAIHHAVTAALRDFCRRHSIKEGSQTAQSSHSAALTGDMLAMETFFDKPASLTGINDYYGTVANDYSHSAQDTVNEPPACDEIRYAGRAFGIFILIEQGDRLYIIDQHAAHERILYNRFISGQIPKQELLVPISFNAGSPEDDCFLETKREELAALAVVIERDGNGWRIDALPADWRLGDAETVQEILDLRSARENIAERWAATLCCHQALRDGDYLDADASLALAREAFTLPDPRCPHGRPVWTEISRNALYKAVRRI